MIFQLPVRLVMISPNGRFLECAVHPFDLSIGPGGVGLCQAMRDAMLPAGSVEGMAAPSGGGNTVRRRLSSRKASCLPCATAVRRLAISSHPSRPASRRPSSARGCTHLWNVARDQCVPRDYRRDQLHLDKSLFNPQRFLSPVARSGIRNVVLFAEAVSAKTVILRFGNILESGVLV